MMKTYVVTEDNGNTVVVHGTDKDDALRTYAESFGGVVREADGYEYDYEGAQSEEDLGTGNDDWLFNIDETTTNDINKEENKMKAKFIRKYYGKGFERDFVYLVYEYRGYEYTVYENRAKGNEPLSWQHKTEQTQIDAIIEAERRPKKPYRYEDSAEYGFDLFMRYINGDETIFDK